MEALSAAAAAAGIPVGSQRFLAATVGCPLLGAALGAVPGKSPTPRHVASLALGLALCVFVYGLPSTLLLLAPVAACYALMAASQRRAGTAVYVFAFAYLLVWCAPQACEQSFSRLLIHGTSTPHPRTLPPQTFPTPVFPPQSSPATCARPAARRGRRET